MSDHMGLFALIGFSVCLIGGSALVMILLDWALTVALRTTKTYWIVLQWNYDRLRRKHGEIP